MCADRSGAETRRGGVIEPDTGRRRGGIIGALTRRRDSQLVDLLVGAFFLILICSWVLAPISGILAAAVFVLVTVAYLVGLANQERERRRERQRPR